LNGISAVREKVQKERLIPVNYQEYLELLKYTADTFLSELETNYPGVSPLLANTRNLLDSGNEDLFDRVVVDLGVLRDLFIVRNTLLFATRNAANLLPVFLSVGPIHGEDLFRLFQREFGGVENFSLRQEGEDPTAAYGQSIADQMSQIVAPNLP
jgi:hypothetical protein